MLEPADLNYFRQREIEERRAARTASHESARAQHAQLAEHYADRVWALEVEQRHRRQA